MRRSLPTFVFGIACLLPLHANADQLLLSGYNPLTDLHPPVSLSPAGVLVQEFTAAVPLTIDQIQLTVYGAGQFEWEITDAVGTSAQLSDVLAFGSLDYPASIQGVGSDLLGQSVIWNPSVTVASGEFFLVFSEDLQDYSNVGYFTTGCWCYPSDFGAVDGTSLYGANPGFAPGSPNLSGYSSGPLAVAIYGDQASAVPEPSTWHTFICIFALWFGWRTMRGVSLRVLRAS